MLTKEQFVELKNKGLSLEQIVSFESGNKPDKQISGANQYKADSLLGRMASGAVQGLSNVGVGIGTEIGKAGLGAGQALLKTGIAASKATGIGKTDFAEQAVEEIEGIKKNLYDKPFEKVLSTVTGKLGTGIGKVAPFVSSTYSAPVTAAQGFLKGASGELLKNAPGIVKATAKIASQAVPEAVGAGVLEYGVSGGDIEKAKQTAKFVGATSAVLGAGGQVYKSLFSPETKTAAIKGLGLQGKVKASQSQQIGENYTDGLKTVVDNSKGLKIKSLDGVEKPFNPKTADFNDTIQAWEHARETVYSKYHKLAQDAGKLNTSKELAQIDDTLEAMLKQPRTSTYKSAVKSVLRDLRDNFSIRTKEGIPQYQNVDAVALETFLKDLNRQGSTVFSGTGDKALGEVSANTAGFIRRAMDDAIESGTGAGYQELRSQYAALKSIEAPLVAQWKRSARKIGGGLGDYIGAYSSGDVIAGLLYANPQAVAAGLSRNILVAALKKVNDPERFLRKALSDLSTEPSVGGLRDRVFSGSAAGTPEFKAGQEAVKGTKEAISGLPEATSNLGKRMEGTFKGYSSGKIIKAHFDEANQVMKDPDIASAIKADPVGFTKGIKDDITRALKEYGYTKELKAIEKIDVDKIKKFSEFRDAVSKIGNNIIKQSGQAGLVGIPTLLGGAATGGVIASSLPSEKTDTSEVKPQESKEIEPEVLSDALMSLESSSGTDKSNADKGEVLWLTGLTPVAIKELKRVGLVEKVDINNKEQVLDASNKYFNLMQKRHPELSPAEIYVDYYWTQWKNEKNPQEARQKKIDEFNRLTGLSSDISGQKDDNNNK